jgi:hypothetical protein
MSAEEVRTQLQTIDPYEFEHFVGELWESQGWETEVSQGSNDMGVDVVATKENGLMDQKAVIQAKRYSDGNKVGRPKIQQYYTLKEQDTDADAAVVVTTSEFTSGAEDWASEHNVKLVDADDLVAIVREEDRYDLVEEYAEPTEEDGGGLLSGLFGGSSTDKEPGDTSPTSSSLTRLRRLVTRSCNEMRLRHCQIGRWRFAQTSTSIPTTAMKTRQKRCTRRRPNVERRRFTPTRHSMRGCVTSGTRWRFASVSLAIPPAMSSLSSSNCLTALISASRPSTSIADSTTALVSSCCTRTTTPT